MYYGMNTLMNNRINDQNTRNTLHNISMNKPIWCRKRREIDLKNTISRKLRRYSWGKGIFSEMYQGDLFNVTEIGLP
jgi:hypothetical protein